jgi:uncharacterized protein (DUF697 family)
VASLLKLPDVWRVLREVDLDDIRVAAAARFRLVVLADDAADASTIVTRIAGVPEHPWIETYTSGATPSEPATVSAALVVTRSAASSAAGELIDAGTPTVLGLIGRPGRTETEGTTARVPIADVETGIDVLAEALVNVAPAGLRLSLARQLPPLRHAVFSAVIEESARANATYALTAGVAEAVPLLDVPLNVADMLILTKNQLLMSYKIALGAGKSGRPRDLITELVGVVGAGFLFRQAARSLVGLVPVIGIVPKVAVAYTGTWAIGRAVEAWATQGRRVDRAALRTFSRQARDRGYALARGLAARRRESPARRR